MKMSSSESRSIHLKQLDFHGSKIVKTRFFIAICSEDVNNELLSML